MPHPPSPAAMILATTLLASSPMAAAQQHSARLEVLGTFEGRVHPDLPTYEFHVWRSVEETRADEDDGDAGRTRGWLERVEVVRSTDDRVLQTLSVDGTLPWEGADYLRLRDMNCDGYGDLLLMTRWGVTGNRSFGTWLFDPKAHGFSRHEGLSELTNPELDPETCTIRSHTVLGSAGLEYRRELHVWRDDELVPVRREVQDLDDEAGHLVRTVRERRDGRWVTIQREIVDVE